MIQIPFNKKQTILPFVLGAAFLIIGGWSMLARTQFYLSGFAGLGLVWITIGIYRKMTPYIRIDSEVIKVYSDFFTKKIRLEDIAEVNRFTGDLIVKSAHKEIYISKSMVNDQDLEQIEKTLTSL